MHELLQYIRTYIKLIGTRLCCYLFIIFFEGSKGLGINIKIGSKYCSPELIKYGILKRPLRTLSRRLWRVEPSNGKAPQTNTYSTTPKLCKEERKILITRTALIIVRCSREYLPKCQSRVPYTSCPRRPQERHTGENRTTWLRVRRPHSNCWIRSRLFLCSCSRPTGDFLPSGKSKRVL